VDVSRKVRLENRKMSSWLADNIVTLIFIVFTVFGFIVSDGVTLNYFLTELSSRFFRNAFLVLSLIIPVVAGLGLNFGIVVGAMAGQIAIAIVRYFNMGGVLGIFLTFLIAFPISVLCGYFTVLAAWGQIMYLQNMGTLNTYGAHTQIGMFSVASILVGGASTQKASVKHAIIGTILFNSMFIISPEIGLSLFGNALPGEYFRTFMVYGVIGLALGLHVWRTNKNDIDTLVN
jgi:hypothetical protein